MRYLTFKLVVGENSGGEIYSLFKKSMLVAKDLDETYKGPEHLWEFYQLGDFNRLGITILKWEVWSSLKVNNNKEMNNAAFIGPSAALFFYYIDEKDSFTGIEAQVKYFNSHKNTNEAPAFLICLFDSSTNSKESIVKTELFQYQNSIVTNELHATLIPMPIDALMNEKVQPVIDTLFRLVTFKLQAKLSQELNIVQEFWRLGLDELRQILYLDKLGKRPRPRLAPPEPPKPPTPVDIEIKPVEESKIEENVVETEPIIDEVKTSEENDQIVSETEKSSEGALRLIGTIDLMGLSDTDIKQKAEDEDVVITKFGEVLKIMEEVPEALVDLTMKGAFIPRRYEIPRHCPKCGNYKQNMIREANDPEFILLDYPRICGIKYICGNCSHEWRKSYEL